jgi:2-keto-3-deoxy-6-phosphogluconate aldolase
VSEKGKNASFLLIVPNFNFEVVTTADEKRLLTMKGNATNGSIMFIEFLE